MSEGAGKFAPKHKVELAPPKDDPISLDHLAKCDGEHEGYPTYVAIKVCALFYFRVHRLWKEYDGALEGMVWRGVDSWR